MKHAGEQKHTGNTQTGKTRQDWKTTLQHKPGKNGGTGLAIITGNHIKPPENGPKTIKPDFGFIWREG